MANRQFYTMKFKSSRLKEFKYNIELNALRARENGEMIALADNQILRSIRNIQNKTIDNKQLEEWYSTRDKLKRENNNESNALEIKQMQDNIYYMMFIPEYITIVMEHKAHYKHLFENGLILNNMKYIRFSSSAGQSRSSTVVFVEEGIAEKLEIVLNNGRNLDKEHTPSKFNAYKGLAGSATKIVSTPRFCVVADYYSATSVKVDFVIETNWEDDDKIDPKEIEQKFSRFDGQGLISYEKAKQWANELGLDYVPAQWCVRQNYIKGMLCTFPIHEFCETENNKNYVIKTSYKDEQGNTKTVDLNEIDVIISESQFKLWDSFDSVEVYQNNCNENKLSWGVSIYTPKQDKDILTMNYQFNQTLNWNKTDIKNVCGKFVDWMNGINIDNIYYTLLFLMGDNNNKKVKEYLQDSSNHWIKALVLNHDLHKDKYIKTKIYDLIKKRIKQGCLGSIIVDGNYQVIVSDPYAMMQHICGKTVTGLLGDKEYYSNYWNKKNVKLVDSMRAPLTFRSEHLKLNLVNNKKYQKWFRYSYSGIIVNAHGCETLHWGGSDYDFDILATTSDPTVIKGVYDNELPVVYEAPTGKKEKLTPEHLYQADLFAFGSIIGSITNKSTSAYALLPTFDTESKEYQVLTNRLKMCTKLQSAQIDKAKIGRQVKGIPQKWILRHAPEEKDSEEVKISKEFNNSLLLDRHPYFFIYLYKTTKAKYKKYVNTYNSSCNQKFGISLDNLINKKRHTTSEQQFLDAYYRFMPIIDSDCVMNNLCKYIESIDFEIKSKIKFKETDEVYNIYKNDNIPYNHETYEKVSSEYRKFKREIANLGNLNINFKTNDNEFDSEVGSSTNGIYEDFKDRMNDLCSNTYELINYLVDIFYVETPSSNKDLLWNIYGEYIYENVKNKNKDQILFPIVCDNGDIEYLNKKYQLVEVLV